MKLFSKSLKPEEVINFLKENPDFFINHPEAIEHLEIKHESGEAVSFIEKQVEPLSEKTSILAPISSKPLETTESPNPLPSFLEVTKGSKILGSMSDGIPLP